MVRSRVLTMPNVVFAAAFKISAAFSENTPKEAIKGHVAREMALGVLKENSDWVMEFTMVLKALLYQAQCLEQTPDFVLPM